MLLILSFEVGGQDIDWHVEYTPAGQDTRDEPGAPEELDILHAMMLTHQVGNTLHRTDVLDLLCEAGSGEVSEPIYYELLVRAAEAYADTREAEEDDRAEAAAEARQAYLEDDRDSD